MGIDVDDIIKSLPEDRQKIIREIAAKYIEEYESAIKPIKTKSDYMQALKRVEHLMDAKENTKEANELEILSILVDDYEEKNFPIDD